MRIVPLSEGTNVGTQLAGLLKDNWVVALVADRDLSGRGIEVEMFGASRRVPAGPALLSLSTGAPLLVCPTYTTPRGWIVRIGGPIEIERSGIMRADVAALTARDGRRVRTGDLGAPARLAHVPARLAAVRVLLVCPYAWEAPGRGAGARPRAGRAAPIERATMCSCSLRERAARRSPWVRIVGPAGAHPVPGHRRSDLVLVEVLATHRRGACVAFAPRRRARARTAHAEHLDARRPSCDGARRRHLPRVLGPIPTDGGGVARAADGRSTHRSRAIAVSEAAATFLRRSMDVELEIVPNGLDVERFASRAMLPRGCPPGAGSSG